MRITVTSVENASLEQEAKLRVAIAELEKVFASPRFKRLSAITIPKEINFSVRFYDDSNSNAAGTADIENNRVRLNLKYYDRSLTDVCGTIAHEYIHIMGYENETMPREIQNIVKSIMRNEEYDLSFWVKAKFWLKYWLVQISYGIVIALGIIFFPVGYFVRHVLKIEGRKNPFWLWLNYTEDNDWGLDHYKDNPPDQNFWNAILWYRRNPAWNYILLFKPEWEGEPDEMLYLMTTVDNREYDIDWPNKDSGKYGKLKTYYLENGVLYGRYGFAQPKGAIKEFQMGAAGNRYKLRVKPIWLPLIIIAIIVLIIIIF